MASIAPNAPVSQLPPIACPDAECEACIVARMAWWLDHWSEFRSKRTDGDE